MNEVRSVIHVGTMQILPQQISLAVHDLKTVHIVPLRPLSISILSPIILLSILPVKLDLRHKNLTTSLIILLPLPHRLRRLGDVLPFERVGADGG